MRSRTARALPGRRSIRPAWPPVWRFRRPRAGGRGQRGRGRRLEEHHSAAEEGGSWKEDYLAEDLDDPVFEDYAA